MRRKLAVFVQDPKPLTSVLGLLGLLLLPSQTTNGLDYYISSSVGDDSATGVTRDQAWRSLARIQTVLLAPGDRVLLRAGDVFSSETLWLRGTGRQDAPLRVLSDDAAGPRPVIAGNASQWPPPAPGSPPQFAIRGNSLGWVEISGLCLSGTTAGIGIDLTPGVQISDIVFQNIWNRSFVGQAGDGRAGCWQGWSWAVSVGPAVENLTVRNCLFDSVDKALSTWGSAGAVSFVNNTVTRANGNAVSAFDTTEWLVEGNVFTRNAPPRFFGCGTCDILIGKNISKGTIRQNEFGWRGEHGGSADGCAIDFEQGSDGIEVSENLIHDTFGAAVMIYGKSDLSHNITNAKILRNIFVRCGGGQDTGDRGTIAFTDSSASGEVADNVIYAEGTAQAFHAQSEDAFSKFFFANNSVLRLGTDPAAGMVTELPMPALPLIHRIVYTSSGDAASIELYCRTCDGGGSRQCEACAHPRTHLLATTDGSWPRGTESKLVSKSPGRWLLGPFRKTVVVNARLATPGLLDGLTMTEVVRVPAWAGSY